MSHLSKRPRAIIDVTHFLPRKKLNIIKINYVSLWYHPQRNKNTKSTWLQWLSTMLNLHILYILQIVNILFLFFCFLLLPFPFSAQYYCNSIDRNISVLSARNPHNCSHYFHLQMCKKMLPHIRFVRLQFIFLFYIDHWDQTWKYSPCNFLFLQTHQLFIYCKVLAVRFHIMKVNVNWNGYFSNFLLSSSLIHMSSSNN